jgi:hypothetical protein
MAETNERTISEGEKLAAGVTVAEIIKLADGIDMAVLDHLLDGQSHWHSVVSMLDPTRYMRENKAMEATFATLLAVRKLKQTIERVRGNDNAEV